MTKRGSSKMKVKHFQLKNRPKSKDQSDKNLKKNPLKRRKHIQNADYDIMHR